MKIGIIGGSGLYNIDGFNIEKEVYPETPFGKPSDKIIIGNISGTEVAFLPRHASNHSLLPSEVPYIANIAALKSLGVNTVISVSAVGSLKEELEPGHAVILNQIFDRTKGKRTDTFFGHGVVGHPSFADPICDSLAKKLFEISSKYFKKSHFGGNYVCVEGPRFSSRHESDFFRQIGGEIIGMTAYPEAALAREAGMCYSTLALVTDYDCWKRDLEPVSVEAVLELMHDNVSKAKDTLKELLSGFEVSDDNCCKNGGVNAVITQENERNKDRLSLIKEYLG
jgi:5'-methylthioadenosine phosphorylase